MHLQTRFKLFSAVAMALVLTACGSDSGNGNGGSGVVTPTDIAGFAGLWEGKTARLGSLPAMAVTSGELYLLFTNVRQSDMVLTLYTKNRTENCLNRTSPVALRASGGNQFIDANGRPITLVLNDLVDNENDLLTLSFPPSVSTIVTNYNRAIGVSAQDLQVCGRVRIDRRVGAGLDSISPALTEVVKP